VIDLNRLFVVLQVVSAQIMLDGYRILYVADITNVEVRCRSGPFIERALALRKQVPSPLTDLDLSSVATVLLSAGRRFPLVTIHGERICRSACWIGQVSSLTTKTVTLHKIGTNAEWYGESRYRLRDITRIDCGGQYEDALALVAGLHANKSLQQPAGA
jgi:hypothetical protein